MSRKPYRPCRTPLTAAEAARLRKSAVYTTGDVARLLMVSARKAVRVLDSGGVPCYRVPGGLDRRVARADLVAFLQREGLPLGPLTEAGCGVLLVGVGPETGGRLLSLLHLYGLSLLFAPDEFTAAGHLLAGPGVAVVNAEEMGTFQATRLGAALRRELPGIRLLGLLPADSGRALPAPYDVSLGQPVDPARLADEIKLLAGVG